MATLTTDGLEALLSGLDLTVPVPAFPAADLLNKPLDIGRAYFADILSNLVGSDSENAFAAITLPTEVSSGDLAAILPKLSHGADPNVVGFDLMKKV
jgi:arginyl-tRNA synthetase